MSSKSLPDFITSITGRTWTFEPNVSAAASSTEETTQTAPGDVQESLAEETAQEGLGEISQHVESEEEGKSFASYFACCIYSCLVSCAT